MDALLDIEMVVQKDHSLEFQKEMRLDLWLELMSDYEMAKYLD